MSSLERLVELALAPCAEAERERLSSLTLANAAAAVGEVGSARTLLGALEGRPDADGERAYRLGVLLHARTQDDFFPRGRCHPGAIVLAAALGVSDRSGGRLLKPLTVGYRVTCAVSAAYAAESQRRGLRPSGVFGPLGGAAAAASALGLDADGVAAAVAIAAANSGGSNQAWISGTDEWLVQVAVASRLAVEAADLAAAGVAASADALEGRAGWAAAFFGDPGAAALAAELDSAERAGPGRAIAEVANKPYPISGIAQVPTDLAVRCHRRLPAGGAEIGDVAVSMNPDEAAYPGSTATGPVTSRPAALMSLRHCVAVGLLDGRVGLDRLERPEDEAVRELADRVEVRPDDGLAETEARIEVDAGGERIELSGRGEEVLYASWADLRDDLEGLAGRSEADPAVVGRVSDCLSAENPDARMLNTIIGEATR